MGDKKFLYLVLLLAVIFNVAAAGVPDGYMDDVAEAELLAPCPSFAVQQFDISSAFDNIPRSSILNKCEGGSGSLSKNNLKVFKSFKRLCTASLLARDENSTHTAEHSFYCPLQISCGTHSITFFNRLNI